MDAHFQRVVSKIEELKSVKTSCPYYFISTVSGYTTSRHGVEECPGYALVTIATRLFHSVEETDPRDYSNPADLYSYATLYGGDSYEYYIYYDDSWHQPLSMHDLCLYYYYTKYTHI